jgi:RNA polymerase sigma factor (TIGR02999 family)
VKPAHGPRSTPPQDEARLARTDDRHDTVTHLLGELQRGDDRALDEIFMLVYDELRALAHRHRRRWHGDETIGTTALVHEAYLKLVDQKNVDANGRAHFLAVAARAMRHILCNYAQARRRQKRGGGLQRLDLDAVEAAGELVAFSDEQADTIAALDAALEALSRFDERLGRVVECRFFGGMSIPDTAAALGTSPATVKRDYALARAWLYRELRSHAEP